MYRNTKRNQLWYESFDIKNIINKFKSSLIRGFDKHKKGLIRKIIS